MNPVGMFKDGKRLRKYSMKDLQPLSGKLIPEFDRRRNIKDMFSRKPSVTTAPSTESPSLLLESDTPSADAAEPPSTMLQEAVERRVASSLATAQALPPQSSPNPASPAPPASPANSTSNKRSLGETSTNRPLKRSKSVSTSAQATTTGKGQQSLKGFFKPKTPAADSTAGDANRGRGQESSGGLRNGSFHLADEIRKMTQTEDINATPPSPTPPKAPEQSSNGTYEQENHTNPLARSPTTIRKRTINDQEDVHDPVVSKESWSKLFTKPAAPRCEGHNEPCISMLTKKSGFNCGRSFWMCARPVGPTGTKERNTQWRCQTFIWCTDWNGGVT